MERILVGKRGKVRATISRQSFGQYHGKVNGREVSPDYKGGLDGIRDKLRAGPYIVKFAAKREIQTWKDARKRGVGKLCAPLLDYGYDRSLGWWSCQVFVPNFVTAYRDTRHLSEWPGEFYKHLENALGASDMHGQNWGWIQGRNAWTVLVVDYSSD